MLTRALLLALLAVAATTADATHAVGQADVDVHASIVACAAEGEHETESVVVPPPETSGTADLEPGTGTQHAPWSRPAPRPRPPRG